MKFEKVSDKILSSREWKAAHLQRKGIKLASKSVATTQTVEANGFRGKMISSLWSYNYRLSTKDPFRQRLSEGVLQAKWKRNLQKRKAWCGRNSGTSPAWCPKRKSQLGSSLDPESWWSDIGTSTNSVIKNPVVVRLWKRRVCFFFEWEKGTRGSQEKGRLSKESWCKKVCGQLQCSGWRVWETDTCQVRASRIPLIQASCLSSSSSLGFVTKEYDSTCKGLAWTMFMWS